MKGPVSSLVVLAGGGTGGHVFPAQALAGELVGRGLRLALVTDRRGVGIGGTIPGLEVHRVRAGPIAGTRGARRLLGGANLALGTLQARRLLARLRPQAVVGFGGYASVPTMLAASFAGIPTAIHEQNALLGRANRILAARVDRIATSHQESEGLPAAAEGKVRWTGMPVRAAVATACHGGRLPCAPPRAAARGCQGDTGDRTGARRSTGLPRRCPGGPVNVEVHLPSSAEGTYDEKISRDRCFH